MSQRDDDELIDKIDLDLFRVLRRSHDLKASKENERLKAAIRVARALSFALLPESKRRSFDGPPPTRDGMVTDCQIVQSPPTEIVE